MTSSNNYVVECTKCSESASANEFEPVRDFAFKHQKHTGHPVNWTQATIDSELSKTLDIVYQVICEECEERWEFEEKPEANDFAQEHASVTDHTPDETKQIERGLKVKKPDDLLKLIDRLNKRTEGEDGAPHDILVRAARHRGGKTQDVEKWLEKFSRQGAVYEPTTGYYRHV